MHPILLICEMSRQRTTHTLDMKGQFSSVTLSERLQRRMGEHETSRALIQSPLKCFQQPCCADGCQTGGATKALLLCFLAGNDTCCFSFQMSFTHCIEKRARPVAVFHFRSLTRGRLRYDSMAPFYFRWAQVDCPDADVICSTVQKF